MSIQFGPQGGEGNTRGELRQESSLSPLWVMPSIEDPNKHKETMGFLFLTFSHDT
jgi:hypothetical protein